MKRILITGANSYIGTSFEKYMAQWPEQYQVDTVDMIGDGWKNRSFAGYDTVFHVAGIVHGVNGKMSAETKALLYYKVNTELTVLTAKKAKAEGVRQFVFMSSMSVYGTGAPINEQKVITKDTPPCPVNPYGDSKLQAEKGLAHLSSEGFGVCILRPPMVYGYKCKGNYAALAKFACISPFFFYVQNQRSVIYIGNLLEFVRCMIHNEECGIFFPQDSEYFSTSVAIQKIRATHKKPVLLLRGFTWALKIACHVAPFLKKAFGNLTYDMALSEYKENYRIYNFDSFIMETERKDWKSIAF